LREFLAQSNIEAFRENTTLLYTLCLAIAVAMAVVYLFLEKIAGPLQLSFSAQKPLRIPPSVAIV
jgi:hypothetical protein